MIDSIVDIYVPSLTKDKLYQEAVESIKANTSQPYKLLETVGPRSIAGNRNYGLNLSDSQFIASLDADCEVTQSNWLDLMLETMISDEKIALVGCKVVMFDNKIFSCGTAPNWRPYDYGEQDNGQREFVEEVVGVSANCLLYRKNSIRYDELFIGGNGLEDSDFCIKLRKNGYRVMYDGRVKIIHKKYPKEKTPFFWNHMYFHLKHPSTLLTQYRKPN